MMFNRVYDAIDAKPADAQLEQIKQTVQKIEGEAKKGEAADPNDLERWLNTLQEMAPDIFEVAIATWVNPIAGVGLVLKKVAEKAKTEAKKKK